MQNTKSYIIAIGTSAGGLEALTTVVSELPADLAAPVLIVQHLSPITTGKVLVQALARTTNLICKLAENGEPLQNGTIYLAPPDYHLMVQKNKVVLTRGAHENRWRPSIDMLLRSVGAEFNSRAIGVILTGLLDDGTAGMKAVKRAGGIAVIQDPADARYPDMPNSVLQNMKVDHVVPLSEMGRLLGQLVTKDLPDEVEIPGDLAQEADIAVRVAMGIELTAPLGPSTYMTCPDCGGVLTETEGSDLVHYRCHTGHSYSPTSLLLAQKENYENTLWIALRMLEERRNMLKITAHNGRKKGQQATAVLMEERAKETENHILRMREMLLSLLPDEDINGDIILARPD